VNQSSNNPAGNKLGPGINESALVEAIETSCYPLQGVVADDPCLSVIDAPVLVVTSPRKASAPVLTPWVRVFDRACFTLNLR
jgi:hypothetical protein